MVGAVDSINQYIPEQPYGVDPESPGDGFNFEDEMQGPAADLTAALENANTFFTVGGHSYDQFGNSLGADRTRIGESTINNSGALQSVVDGIRSLSANNPELNNIAGNIQNLITGGGPEAGKGKQIAAELGKLETVLGNMGQLDGALGNSITALKQTMEGLSYESIISSDGTGSAASGTNGSASDDSGFLAAIQDLLAMLQTQELRDALEAAGVSPDQIDDLIARLEAGDPEALAELEQLLASLPPELATQLQTQITAVKPLFDTESQEQEIVTDPLFSPSEEQLFT